jgi:hypothetical protein
VSPVSCWPNAARQILKFSFFQRRGRRHITAAMVLTSKNTYATPTACLGNLQCDFGVRAFLLQGSAAGTTKSRKTEIMNASSSRKVETYFPSLALKSASATVSGYFVHFRPFDLPLPQTAQKGIIHNKHLDTDLPGQVSRVRYCASISAWRSRCTIASVS